MYYFSMKLFMYEFCTFNVIVRLTMTIKIYDVLTHNHTVQVKVRGSVKLPPPSRFALKIKSEQLLGCCFF